MRDCDWELLRPGNSTVHVQCRVYSTVHKEGKRGFSERSGTIHRSVHGKGGFLATSVVNKTPFAASLLLMGCLIPYPVLAKLPNARSCKRSETLFKSLLFWLAGDVSWLAVEVLSPCLK